MSDAPYDPEKPEEVLQAERSPDNVGNPLAIANKKREARFKEKAEDEFLAALLNAPAGRDFLRKIIFGADFCRINETTENAAYDTNGLHFREGARAVGLNLQRACLRANPPGYVELLKDHHIPKDGK